MRSRVGLVALYFGLHMALAWPTLRWPMVYDDLHVIRPFSGAELLGTLHGTWDPDRIETNGFRPLTTLFNHLRAVALGEKVLAHRLLIIGLFSLYLGMLACLAGRAFRTSACAAVVGCAFMLFNHHSVYHYVWLIDGVHCLQGLAFAGAGLLLIRGLESGARVPLVCSGLLTVLGCLVREDTLVIVPALLLVGRFSGAESAGRTRRTRLLWYAVWLGAACLTLVGYRALAVPAASPPAFSFTGWLSRIGDMLNPVGNASFDLLSAVARVGGWVILGGLGAWLAWSWRTGSWRTPALWLLCAAIACSATTTFARGDLFFFASSFVGLAYATALDVVARGVPRGRGVALACAAWLMLGGAYTSRAVALNFHPDSTTASAWNGEMLYKYPRAAMPAVRRAALVRRMEALGIHDWKEFVLRLEELESACLRAGRRRPTTDGQVFYPLARAEGIPVGRPLRREVAGRLRAEAVQDR